MSTATNGSGSNNYHEAQQRRLGNGCPLDYRRPAAGARRRTKARAPERVVFRAHSGCRVILERSAFSPQHVVARVDNAVAVVVAGDSARRRYIAHDAHAERCIGWPGIEEGDISHSPTVNALPRLAELLGANVVIDVIFTSLSRFALLLGTLSHPQPTGSGALSVSSKATRPFHDEPIDPRSGARCARTAGQTPLDRDRGARLLVGRSHPETSAASLSGLLSLQ
jgi:hypothetical protein